jgi:hypothetical protein
VAGSVPAASSARTAAPAAPAQPVERRLGRAGRADRLEHGQQRGWNLPAGTSEQRRGPPPQAAALTPAALIELVFQAAVSACAGDGLPGAAGAGVSIWAGRRDQPPQLPAGCAPCPAPQRGGVARVADRAFGPAGLRRAVLAAAGAAGGRPRRARRADRMAAAGEVAFPTLAAHAADGAGHPVAADADVRRAAAGPHRDRGTPAADPAPAVPAVAAAAPLADALPGGVTADDRLDLAAVRAGSGDLPGRARLAHAPAGRAVKRHACPAAALAPGQGQRFRPAGDQLGGQAPGHRRRRMPEHVWIGGQRRGQFPQHCRAGGHRVHRGGGLAGRHRPIDRDHVPDQRIPAACGARPPQAVAGQLVTGGAASRHRAPGPGTTRARTGRGRCPGGRAGVLGSDTSVLGPIFGVLIVLTLLGSGVVWLEGADRTQAVAALDGAAPAWMGKFTRFGKTPCKPRQHLASLRARCGLAAGPVARRLPEAVRDSCPNPAPSAQIGPQRPQTPVQIQPRQRYGPPGVHDLSPWRPGRLGSGHLGQGGPARPAARAAHTALPPCRVGVRVCRGGWQGEHRPVHAEPVRGRCAFR